MKLGFGFYRHMLNREHYDFAVQCGSTHAIVHLVDYFYQGQTAHGNNQPIGDVELGWGYAGGTPECAWSVDSLKALKAELNEAGLVFEAIENFDPAHWHDILLDGPKKHAQIKHLYQPDMYQRLLDTVPSESNALEFCLGTLSEMTEGDIYDVCERYVKQNKVAYIHFRNVRGKVPQYAETFIDDGQIDMRRIMRILRELDYDGVLIPDHTPQMSCPAPWHAGMAFAMGYIKALMEDGC